MNQRDYLGSGVFVEHEDGDLVLFSDKRYCQHIVRLTPEAFQRLAAFAQGVVSKAEEAA